MCKLLNILSQKRTQPVNEKDWVSLEVAIGNYFTPHTPITEEEFLAGRVAVLERMVDAVFQKGEHVVLHGNRGVGKSSAANILKDRILQRSDFFLPIKMNCTQDSNFCSIWKNLFDEAMLDGEPISKILSDDPTPHEIYKLIDAIGPQRVVLIIDEFDRVACDESKVKMADLIKYLSDYGSDATIILVGVADSVAELFEGHESIVRNIDQIELPTLGSGEVKDIVIKRMDLLNMKLEDDILDLVVCMAQGLPGYAHLLGSASAISCVKDRRLEITSDDFMCGLSKILSKVDSSITDLFLTATRSTKPTNLFREVLLACALTQPDEKGFFSAAAISPIYAKILGRPVTISNYSRQLGEFVKIERGPILDKVGQERGYQYRFLQPLLRPYVIMRGYNEQLIEKNLLLETLTV